MRKADVYLFGRRSGMLTEDDNGAFSFQYDALYLQDPFAVAISSTIPLRNEAYVSDVLFPFFDGLIPEGWLLDIAERNWKLDGRDRMGLLLACCSSTIGAASICIPGETPPQSEKTGRQKSFNDKAIFEFPYSDDEINKMAESLVASRISVCGVQPKLSVHFEQEKSDSPRITIVGFDGDYILKLPTKVYPQLIESEFAAMTLARKCGIRTAEFFLARLSGDRLAYVTKRMDRIPHMKHMEDFCQLTERLSERKYFGSYEQIARKIRLYSETGGVDVIRLFEVVLFSFLIGNSDMHLKNFSLLREDDGAWRLSNAYDLLPVKLILPEDVEDMALKLNGKKAKINGEDFFIFAKTIGMTKQQTMRAISRITDSLIANVDEVIRSSPLSDEFASRFQQLVHMNLNRIAEKI